MSRISVESALWPKKKPRGSGVCPDLEPNLGRRRRSIVAARHIEHAAYDAHRVRSQTPERQIQRRPAHLRVGLGDDIGAVSVAALLADAGAERRALWLDQADARAQSDARALGAILDKDIQSAGKGASRREGESLSDRLAVLQKQPGQRSKAAQGAKGEEYRQKPPDQRCETPTFQALS